LKYRNIKDNILQMKPLIVGVAGGSASGKTSVCEVVFERIGVSECTILSLDNFYKECT
jgi:uridine kinase